MGKPFKAIVGLGNPGQRYAQTRHNAGFWLLDRIASRYAGAWRTERRFFGQLCECEIAGRRVRLLKPSTYMNESGRAVNALIRYYGIDADELIVAHDEIDLPPGVMRLKRGGGHGGHNGLRDIVACLSSREFVRVRIGVGHPGTSEQVTGYVLSRAREDERRAIEDSIDQLVAALDDLLRGDLDKVMNALHRRTPTDSSIGP